MEDIEDMFKDQADLVETARVKDRVKVKRSKGKEQAADLENDEKAAPGSQSVFVKTYGCSHNISDSEYMAGLLADYGFTIVDDMEKADACLLNSCTVKNPSQEKFVNLI